MPSRLVPLPLVAPGSLGINREAEFTLLDPRWCVNALNAVLDQQGQLRSRKGWALPDNQVAMVGTHDVEQTHEYIRESGATVIISASNNKIFKGWDDDFTNATNDITSSTAPTANKWKFVNFADKVLGWQAGHTPIAYTGSGDFTDITASSGSLPNGNEVCAAFGRVWAVDDDLQTIGYSALLDETKWAAPDGGGTINMRHIWTQGTDQVVAVRAFGANLVVFGKRHIVFWADGSGSEIGLDPQTMIVTDTIEGTGAISRDCFAPFGEGDLGFLSPHGVQLLGRVIVNKNNPTVALTKNYKSALDVLLAAENLETLRAAYSRNDRFFLLILPVNKMVLCLDTRIFVPDESGEPCARVTEWFFANEPHSLCSRLNGDLLLGFNGVIGRYEGYIDNGSPYQFDYLSVWLKIDPSIETLIKIVKALRAILFTGGAYAVRFKWNFDFGSNSETLTRLLEGIQVSEYGSAEFGEAEYVGPNVLRVITIPGAGSGKYLQVGVSTSINGFYMAIQYLQVLAKLGRMD